MVALTPAVGSRQLGYRKALRIVQTVDLSSGQSLGQGQPDLSPTLDDKHGLVVDTIRFTSLR